MTERVARLRAASLETRPSLDGERAELMTDFYEQAPSASIPVLRALAFKYLLEHKSIWIGDGELIVGERGPRPKATPTYRDLIVRVAGYSDYFCDLTHALQDEIIARTEQSGF